MTSEPIRRQNDGSSETSGEKSQRAHSHGKKKQEYEGTRSEPIREGDPSELFVGESCRNNTASEKNKRQIKTTYEGRGKRRIWWTSNTHQTSTNQNIVKITTRHSCARIVQNVRNVKTYKKKPRSVRDMKDVQTTP